MAIERNPQSAVSGIQPTPLETAGEYAEHDGPASPLGNEAWYPGQKARVWRSRRSLTGGVWWPPRSVIPRRGIGPVVKGGTHWPDRIAELDVSLKGGPWWPRRMAHAAEPGYVGLGWLPDVPDARDHSKEELDQELKSQLGRKASGKAVSKAMAALRMRGSDGSNGSGGSGAAVTAPPWIDLRLSGWLSPIEDQESLGSCTANAVVSMLEAVRRRLTGEHEDLSRLFLYKITRKLLGWDGDTGAFIRETIKATRTHGVPPEERWPYVISRFDEEPDAFLYSFAANYKATLYARLDLYSNTAWQNLDALRSTLAEGNPVAFGFPVYDSINRPINWQGEVPYPQPGDKQVGGHAVLAVGYDDKIKIAGSKLDDSKGAIIFQNSWGEEWGDDGFGYLPYDYFLEGLAMDLWTVTSAEWIDTSKFA